MLPSKKELALRYARYENDRLLDIIFTKGCYTSEAIEVARKELQFRNIGVRDIDEYLIQKEYNDQIAVEQRRKATCSLSEKILFFIVWLSPLIIKYGFGIDYQKEGAKTKILQSRIFALSGLFAQAITFYMAITYHYSTQKFVTLLFLFFLLTFLSEKKFRS
jgi:hypothetical protein